MVANYYFYYKVMGNEAGWESVGKVEWFQDQEFFYYNIMFFYKQIFVYKY